MRRRAFLAAAALAPALAAGAPAARFERGLLWRIEHKGVAPSYVYGTLHAEDPELQSLPPPVLRAFGSAHALMLEHVASRYGSERFLEAAIYTDDHTLEQAIGPEDFERAVQALAPIGVTRDFVRRVKPWGVLLNLRMSHRPGGGETPDAQLYAMARQRRVPVSQIENVEEQVFTFDEMSTAAQVGLVHHFLTHVEALDALAERSLRAYLARDLRGLWDAQQDYARAHPEIAAYYAEMMKRVVLDRSVVMAFRMQRELRHGSAFVAVGALHLYGEKGVLALLAEDGYSARRVY
ncbi:MAG: TraB/GumN family protein [Burkholderiales bacterium]